MIASGREYSLMVNTDSWEINIEYLGQTDAIKFAKTLDLELLTPRRHRSNSSLEVATYFGGFGEKAGLTVIPHEILWGIGESIPNGYELKSNPLTKNTPFIFQGSNPNLPMYLCIHQKPLPKTEEAFENLAKYLSNSISNKAVI